MATRAVALVTGGDTRLAGLIVTLLMGAVAAGVLWMLTSDRVAASGSVDDGQLPIRAVLYLAAAPYGIFLTAGYTEATFLAVAMGAWLAASRQLWWLSGLLMALTVSVRINGLFVVAALALMYLLQLRAERRWTPRRDVFAFALPVLMLVAIAAWLRSSTGSWNAWQEAEERGWERGTALPWQGLVDGWNEITAERGPHVLVASAMAFAVVVLGIALVGVFAWLRRWPEALFLALNVAVLVCSTTFVSAPRYALSWFPVYILAAEAIARVRGRWLHPAVLLACLPFLATFAMLYAQNAWVA